MNKKDSRRKAIKKFIIPVIITFTVSELHAKASKTSIVPGW
jgi:hypothetical protein